jgi:hypothetical protein
MTVKIVEMEMPKSCYVCWFLERTDQHTHFCYLTRVCLDDKYYCKRPSWCPLQEVKE